MRWTIAGLLFASTTINYIDRQTLSVLAPCLKTEFTWTNSDFALIVIAFRVAYAFGQTASGRLLDRFGTRRGLLWMVGWYSIAAMATSLATGLKSFAFFRFLLGTGESANWPGAAKAVSEWFPHKERGWAVALSDSGSGDRRRDRARAGAGPLPRVRHVATGVPESRGRLRLCVDAGVAAVLPREDGPYKSDETDGGPAPSMVTLLKRKEAWGIILGRSLTDPVWFFISDWFAIFLVAKGFRLEETIAGFWVPFLAADLGNFAGGGFWGWLIARGWPVARARKMVVVLGGAGMTLLIPAIFVSSFLAIVSLFAVATFSYAALSTMILALPADLFRGAAAQ